MLNMKTNIMLYTITEVIKSESLISMNNRRNQKQKYGRVQGPAGHELH